MMEPVLRWTGVLEVLTARCTRPCKLRFYLPGGEEVQLADIPVGVRATIVEERGEAAHETCPGWAWWQTIQLPCSCECHGRRGQ